MSALEQKDPDVAKTYSIDWFKELVTPAPRSTAVALGAIVRTPLVDTGLLYECTVAGRTQERYPWHWPALAGETLRDGSVVWTARHPSDVSASAVSSAVWTVPTGITLDSQAEDGFFTHATLSGGTDGEDYDLVCRMTPSVGDVAERTITVRVRAE